MMSSNFLMFPPCDRLYIILEAISSVGYKRRLAHECQKPCHPCQLVAFSAGAPLARTHAILPAEQAAEMSWIGKAEVIGDARNC